MNIFSDKTGRMVLVPDVGFPLTISPEGWPGAVAAKSVITQFGVSTAGNYQFVHTLRNFVYVYVFGDRISEINMSGISFAADCLVGAPTGMELVWDYYRTYRIAARGVPVGIAIGTRMSFRGFLTSFTTATLDPQFGLSQWAMKFHFVPTEPVNPRRRSISGAAGTPASLAAIGGASAVSPFSPNFGLNPFSGSSIPSTLGEINVGSPNDGAGFSSDAFPTLLPLSPASGIDVA